MNDTNQTTEQVSVSRELLEEVIFQHKDTNKFERARNEIAALLRKLPSAPGSGALLTPLELVWVISAHEARAKADLERGDEESAERRQIRIRELRSTPTKGDGQ